MLRPSDKGPLIKRVIVLSINNHGHKEVFLYWKFNLILKALEFQLVQL